MAKRKRKRRLTPKQARFIGEYFACGMNATEAAKRAGYSAKTAYSQGQRLLKHVEVSRIIAERQEGKAEELQITADDIARELAKLSFSNMEDYMTVDEYGHPHLDLSKLSRDQAAAITEVNVETYMEGRGDLAVPVKKAKVKVADKRGALDSLAKLLGMMPDRHEISGAGGGPIVTRIERVIVDPSEGDEA